MPEGPEIRRAADALAAAIVGHTLRRVFFGTQTLAAEAERLVGSRIESILPRGKALLTRFSGGWTLYSHNQLYGVWRIGKPGERPATRRSLRVELESDTAAIRLYSASDIELWPSARIESHPFLQRIGPDVLDPALDPAQVAARLASPSFRRRRLESLLLDQAFLAGMGNYLRAEVLFEARLDPVRRAGELDPDETERLAQALLHVPRRSYRTRGIAPARGMRRDHTHEGETGFSFAVFDRAGEPCPACGGAIERREAAGRRLYLCPSCQR